MANLLTLANGYPIRTLQAGDLLITAGESGGELYVLERGRLTVERDGVEIATISEPGALVGEMSVLLGDDHSANVRAIGRVEVRYIEDGISFLERTPLAALSVATLACARLEATSRLLAELRRDTAGRASEQGLLNRLFGAVSGQQPMSRPPRN